MNTVFKKTLLFLFIMGSGQNFGQSSQLKSMLEIYSLETGERKVIYEEKAHFEAPNWSPDGNYLILNQNGL